eukprot:4553534-Amphidinium_carterae.1
MSCNSRSNTMMIPAPICGSVHLFERLTECRSSCHMTHTQRARERLIAVRSVSTQTQIRAGHQ